MKYILLICIIVGGWQYMEANPESGLARFVNQNIERARLQWEESTQVAKREAEKLKQNIPLKR